MCSKAPIDMCVQKVYTYTELFVERDKNTNTD